MAQIARCIIYVSAFLLLASYIEARFLKKNFPKTDPSENVRKFLTGAVQAGGLDSIRNIENVRSKLSQFRQSKRKIAATTSDALLAAKAKNIQKLRQQDDEEPVDTIGDINQGLEQFLYDGDMMLNDAQANQLTQQTRQKRQAYTSATARWPKNAPIPYTIDSSINDTTTVKLIHDAIAFWQNMTCLTFKEDNKTSPRIKFYNGAGCSSYVGRVTSLQEQLISIGDRCGYFGIIAHEIAHSLGIFHHQSRTDRDNYIDIVMANVPAGWEDNMDIQPLSNNYGISYEYGSSLHYAEKSWFHIQSMGNRNMPTFADVQLINKYYTCSSACSKTITCKNNGYQNPANCSKCICPGGFGGDDCSKVADPEYGASNCGGNLTATTSWQTLIGQVGESSTVIYPRQAACHWHVNAPEGKKINIKVNYVRGPCSLGCFYGSTEIKLGNFTLTGVRLCCSSDIASNSQFQTVGNLAVISAHSQLAVEKFSLQYMISS
ncbi:hypothetical protein FO519_002147 [Halicephalobus sp. NKZ332]|nr:hypothetical protein FO519_002147 [Halicephalobus sp. NKZ332]